MKGVKLKFALALKEEMFCGPNESRPSFISVVELDTSDYGSLEEFTAAIEKEKTAAAVASGQKCIYMAYMSMAPFPGDDFFPTGGVCWHEKAWEYAGYINGVPASGSLKIGDKVRYANVYGVTWIREIFGFDKTGDAILNRDCYWCSVEVSKLKLVE